MLKYRMLGKSGLRVSEVCLGTMSFGQDWDFGADEAESHRVLDAFAEAGGNFLDTANKYHNGETETIVGKWLVGKRDRTVVATKYSLAMDHSDVNSAGNSRKNLMRSVEGSLSRLKTDYIDLLWVHAWDDQTPMEETLRGLDDVIRSGKVLYVGISDTPAWVVSASQVWAELRGLSPYVALQVEYSLLARTPERDLLPMAENYGMTVTAWGPLAGGVLTGKYSREGADADSKRRASNEGRGRTSERAMAIARRVDRTADELGATSAQVALAWLQAKGYAYIPIVGARKVSQLRDSLGACSVRLSEQQLAALDEASAIELGFPHDFLASAGVQDMVKSESRTRLVERPGPGHTKV